jgi:predicted glutamine amidotransferase
MCRWMAWHGQPVLIEELLFKTRHGIVDQSLHSRMGAEPTNGDGFGLGWYGGGEGPAVYHSVAPAWGNANLRELAAHVESPMFLAHVRAAIGITDTGDQLPSLPSRALVVRTQRLRR